MSTDWVQTVWPVRVPRHIDDTEQINRWHWSCCYSRNCLPLSRKDSRRCKKEASVIKNRYNLVKAHLDWQIHGYAHPLLWKQKSKPLWLNRIFAFPVRFGATALVVLIILFLMRKRLSKTLRALIKG